MKLNKSYKEKSFQNGVPLPSLTLLLYDLLRVKPKDSFLRALREVAHEMELFLENHWQYIKKIVIKLIYIQCVDISVQTLALF